LQYNDSLLLEHPSAESIQDAIPAIRKVNGLCKGMAIVTHCNNNSGLGWVGIAKDLKKILIIGNIYCLHSDCYNEESN